VKIKQLQYLQEIVRHDLVISDAAAALHTSQSGVSKEVRLLEEELGVVIFARNRSRLISVTTAGQRVLALAERMLADAHKLRHVATEDKESGGPLRVATTHTQGLYVLPKIIKTYLETHPNVRLRLRQGTPAQIWQLLAAGEADIAISSGPKERVPEVAMFECGRLPRVVLTPPRHPLLRLARVTLEDVAGFPLITYDDEFIGRSKVQSAFAAHSLAPDIVLSATDSDVIKAYVKLGLGVAIIAEAAFDSTRDRGLRSIDASHLFPPNDVYLGVRHDFPLPEYVMEFVDLIAPQLRTQVHRAAMSRAAQDPVQRKNGVRRE